MSEKWLLFDIGNTRVKWGVLQDGSMTRSGSVSHEDLKTRGFTVLTRRLPRSADGAFACNVAGANFGRQFARAVGMQANDNLRYAHSQRSGFGVKNGYREARSIGVDRWVAMVGARAEFRTALCVVDAGTAVTIDAIDREGQHLGGQIIPGLSLMASSLRRDTSDIGAARGKTRDPAADSDLFGNTTDRAVHYGSIAAVCGAVERSFKSLKGQGGRPKIVLTGGDASRILKQLGLPAIHRPNLVLNGLATMIESDT